MERYLREAFLREEELTEKLSAPFDFVHLKKEAQQVAAVPSAPQPAGGAMPAAPPTGQGHAGAAQPDKEQMLRKVLENMQKSPVISLFSKNPAPEEASEQQGVDPTQGQPQQGMPKMASAGTFARAYKLLRKAQKAQKAGKFLQRSKMPKVVPKPTLSKAPPGKFRSARQLVQGYKPPKVPRPKLPSAVKPIKQPSVVSMNKKVEAPKPLLDKLKNPRSV